MALIITWNMQGGQGTYGSKWQEITNRVNNPAHYGLPEPPSVILLQECSLAPRMQTPHAWGLYNGAPGLTRGSINFGTFRAPKCYFILHQAWAANNSKSFAVLIWTNANVDPNNPRIRISNNLTANIRFINPPPQMVGNTRPVIGVAYGRATFYSMHAPSGVPVGCSRTYIDWMINSAFRGGPHILGGDFNCEPQILYPQAYPIPHDTFNLSGQVTYMPPGPHQVPKQYDYFVSSNNAPSHTILTNVNRINLISDHYGVCATF